MGFQGSRVLGFKIPSTLLRLAFQRFDAIRKIWGAGSGPEVPVFGTFAGWGCQFFRSGVFGGLSLRSF